MTALDHASRSPTASPGRPRTTLSAATLGLARRSLRNIVRLPSAFLPSVLMPIVQAIAFSGTFFAIVQIPGFPTDRSINWFLPLAVMMGSGFAGIGMGFAAIRDLESGFYDRLRMTPAPRRALVTGPLAAALARGLIVTTVVILVGTLFGARLTHGPLGLVPLYVAGTGVATIGTGWALGLAFRFRDMRAAAIMQLTFFLAIFLTDAQTPIDVMEGWLEVVARINPFTNVTALARMGYLDTDPSWSTAVAGVVTLVVLGVLALWFARRGLESLGDT